VKRRAKPAKKRHPLDRRPQLQPIDRRGWRSAEIDDAHQQQPEGAPAPCNEKNALAS
jgi:hypothetical protein